MKSSFSHLSPHQRDFRRWQPVQRMCQPLDLLTFGAEFVSRVEDFAGAEARSMGAGWVEVEQQNKGFVCIFTTPPHKFLPEYYPAAFLGGLTFLGNARYPVKSRHAQ